MPPCGVPVSESSLRPVSVMTPALRNAFTNARTCLSFTRRRTRSIKAVCSIESKHASMSASSTHRCPRVPSRWMSAIASCALRRGRNP